MTSKSIKYFVTYTQKFVIGTINLKRQIPASQKELQYNGQKGQEATQLAYPKQFGILLSENQANFWTLIPVQVVDNNRVLSWEHADLGAQSSSYQKAHVE